jgi:hypothetical protein
MTLPQSNPDLYQHVRVVISIIVGLCITTLLSGFARFVQHPKREKVSILHLGWAASLLLSIIHFWWWEFRLALVPQWTFSDLLLRHPLRDPLLFSLHAALPLGLEGLRRL